MSFGFDRPVAGAALMRLVAGIAHRAPAARTVTLFVIVIVIERYVVRPRTGLRGHPPECALLAAFYPRAAYLTNDGADLAWTRAHPCCEEFL